MTAIRGAGVLVGEASDVLVRFLSNVFAVVAGTLLLASSFAFGSGTLEWLALAAGSAVAVVVLAVFPVRGRGTVQRALDVVAVAAAIWTILTAPALSGAHLKWSSVGAASAFLVLGVLGLLTQGLELDLALRKLAMTSNRSRAAQLVESSGRQSADNGAERSSERKPVRQHGRG
jgi:hypothetical protein